MKIGLCRFGFFTSWLLAGHGAHASCFGLNAFSRIFRVHCRTSDLTDANSSHAIILLAGSFDDSLQGIKQPEDLIATWRIHRAILWQDLLPWKREGGPAVPSKSPAVKMIFSTFRSMV